MNAQLKSNGLQSSLKFEVPEPVAIAKFAADGLSNFFERRVNQLKAAVQKAEQILIESRTQYSSSVRFIRFFLTFMN